MKVELLMRAGRVAACFVSIVGVRAVRQSNSVLHSVMLYSILTLRSTPTFVGGVVSLLFHVSMTWQRYEVFSRVIKSQSHFAVSMRAS